MPWLRTRRGTWNPSLTLGVGFASTGFPCRLAPTKGRFLSLMEQTIVGSFDACAFTSRTLLSLSPAAGHQKHTPCREVVAVVSQPNCCAIKVRIKSSTLFSFIILRRWTARESTPVPVVLSVEVALRPSVVIRISPLGCPRRERVPCSRMNHSQRLGPNHRWLGIP